MTTTVSSKRTRFLAAGLLILAAFLVWRKTANRESRIARFQAAAIEKHEKPGELQTQLVPTPLRKEDRILAREQVAVLEAGFAIKHAVLVVTVTQSSSGAPLADFEVRWRVHGGEARNAESAGSKRTDSAGRCTLRVPAGAPLVVESGGAPGEDGIHLGKASESIASLLPDAERKLQLILPTLPKLLFRAQVVDERTDNPLEGARVFRPDGISREYAQEAPTGSLLAISDSEGIFELPRDHRNQTELHFIYLEGYGMTYFPSKDGFSDRKQPVKIRLRRSATLVGNVTDDRADGCGEHTRLQLTCDLYHLKSRDELGSSVPWTYNFPDPIWSVWLDANGGFEITVPAAVALRAECHCEELSTSIGSLLTLKPGERRIVDWRLGGGSLIRGRLLDQFGVALTEKEILLISRGLRLIPLRESFLLFRHEHDQAHARTRSDEQGRFSFLDVPPGSWWIVPAGDFSRGSVDANALAPLATKIDVLESAVQEVEIRAWRGLAIHGHLLDPDGNPVAGEIVDGYCESPRCSVSTTSAKDGSYSLGPLVPGSYQIRVSHPESFAPPTPVSAQAGDRNVDLVMRESGSLLVEIAQAPDASVDAWISAHEGKGWNLLSDDEGRLHCDGIEPGVYDLSVRTHDGRFGIVRDIVIVQGRETGPVQVTLLEGAILTVRYEGARPVALVSVLSGLARVAGDQIHTMTSKEFVVPAGALSVKMQLLDGPDQSHDLVLEAGETRTIKIED